MNNRTPWYVWTAVALLALNLRPVAASIGPVMPDLDADLHFSAAQAGLLTALPNLCFAAFGFLAPGLARRFGVHAVIMVAILTLLLGQFTRAWASGPAMFLVLSAVALSGMAIGNVLMPSLVRRHWPDNPGAGTSLYSVFIAIGVTVASIAPVPLTHAVGGWRAAFAWGTALTVLLVLAWLPMLKFNAPQAADTPPSVGIRDIAGTRSGWALALFFALQSAQAYTAFGWLPSIYMDAGVSQETAGNLLGVVNGLGIIPAFLVPWWLGRRARPWGTLLLIQGMLLAALMGLMLAPGAAPWLWAILMAGGLAGFPFFLALLGNRAETADGTAAMSAFAQCVGYLFAALGPFGLRMLYDGSWTLPLTVQVGMAIVMALLGLYLCRDWRIEDELGIEAA